MLTCLTIRHFLLIDHLTINFHSGMSVLTGETGTGKSIVCDALGLLFGTHANRNIIQEGHKSCEISAQFDYQNLPFVQKWLLEHQFLQQPDAPMHNIVRCHITRLVSQIGPARAAINGKTVKVHQLKLLGQLLIAVQGQHDQQRLLKQAFQRECVDYYGQHIPLVNSVTQAYDQYTNIDKQRKQYLLKLSTQQEELQLLSYQLQELENIQFEPKELGALEAEQSRLGNAKQILDEGYAALSTLHEEESIHILHLFKKLKAHIHKISHLDNQFQPILHKVASAEIQIEEIERALRDQLSTAMIDPERLSQVEERLMALHQLARKHNISIEALPALTQGLKVKYDQLSNIHKTLLALEQKQAQCLASYQVLARELTQKRQLASEQLQALITRKIQDLGMAGGQFEIRLRAEKATIATPYGYERIEFYFSSTPGQPLHALAKSVSGGELSRIYLTVQTLIAQVIAVPTLIFDEMDTGIGGSIAERMGLLLKTLGSDHQVICITHLPQVAALAQHHYQVKKQNENGKTRTRVLYLNIQEERITEVARMLGGIQMTDQTFAYAKAMLHIE